MPDDERLPDPMSIGIDDEPLPDNYDDYVSARTQSVDRDGPMGRITIDTMELDELDQLLGELRVRRLVRVEQLRQLEQAKQLADTDAELARFERLVARVRKSLDKMANDDTRVGDELNKLRIMAVAIGG